MSLRLHEFSEGADWSSWIERLAFYFEANEITQPTKKRAFLLSQCGERTYQTIRALVHPRLPAEVDYAELVQILSGHFDPKPTELLGRCKFHKRDQLPSESISQYVTELRSIAKECNFGTPAATNLQTTAESGDAVARPADPVPASDTSLPLNVMLRDRLICGVRDPALQQRLLTERNITFERALDLALAAESALNQQAHIKGMGDSQQINAMAKKVPNKKRKKDRQHSQPCFRCDGQHDPSGCRFRDAVCHFCKKKGHIEKACRSKKSQMKDRTTNQLQPEHEDVTVPSVYTLHNVRSEVAPKITMALRLNDVPHVMEVDSGAAFSIIGDDTYRNLWRTRRPKLQPEPTTLSTWSGQPLTLLGKISVTVQLDDSTHVLPLRVVKGAGSSLLGRDWFQYLGISVKVNQMRMAETVDTVLAQYSDVFDPAFNGHSGTPVHITMKQEASPKFLKARPVPFALRDAVFKELEKLETQGILEPVQASRWATPIVIVRKKDNTLRICGDYRTTVNASVELASYPLPTIDQLLSTLRGGKFFSRVDLTQAYQQLRVDDATAEALTITTLKGLFKVKRLPFGVSVSPLVFQQFMDQLLMGLDGVVVYLDDILISAATMEEHSGRLTAVLQRLRQARLKAKRAKCIFGVQELEFLGHIVNAEGVRPSHSKIQAIADAPPPTNKAQLQSFLGMLAFYCKFIKDRATIAESLHRLLDAEAPWRWEEKHQRAFDELKGRLLSAPVLQHYDEKKPLFLSCDASPYGLGAVLAQPDDHGNEAPIAFASRTLGKAERNYAQLDKEGLAIVFAVTHFHQYIAGREVIIYSDHKPLLGIMGADRPIPAVLSPRMTRWCLLLGAYSYKLHYRPGKRHQNADALSRLPLPVEEDEPAGPGDVLMIEAVSIPPLTPSAIAQSTAQDTTLSRVYQGVQSGYVSDWTGKDFLPFNVRRNELSTHKGCLLWGSRVVIPPALQSQALTLLHAGHRGMTAMKHAARSYFWWPQLDTAIENAVSSCHTCQRYAKSLPRQPPPVWSRPRVAWSVLHMDLAGPIHGQSYLVVVDAVTKWLEVRPVSTATSSTLIDALRAIFATFGLPQLVVSDNGTAFVSSEMKSFFSRNGIRHVTSAPYHPATNGQAERMVQELKRALKKHTQGSIQCRLSRFLLNQHTTAHAVTKETPAKQMFGRELRTALDAIHPHYEDSPPDTQAQLDDHFKVGQTAWFRTFTNNGKWCQVKVCRKVGKRSYEGLTQDGRLLRRHVDHMRRSSSPVDSPPRLTSSFRFPTGDINSPPARLPVPPNDSPCPTDVVPVTSQARSRHIPQWLSTAAEHPPHDDAPLPAAPRDIISGPTSSRGRPLKKPVRFGHSVSD
ncbi:uncharacterized protein K02A2.6-like [Ornithodoros turicata]|uniref:uncharacterized protein K02A2.6-like n=1 Tax=Ornithodoros turicata TaxID=34597 RepID=UPI003139FC25